MGERELGDEFRITVTITRADNPPPIVPGSVTHAVMVSGDTDNHRVLQLARDAAEATVLGFLLAALDSKEGGER